MNVIPLYEFSCGEHVVSQVMSFDEAKKMPTIDGRRFVTCEENISSQDLQPVSCGRIAFQTFGLAGFNLNYPGGNRH